MPFAGFFTEAHPSDREIRQLNVKNQPEDVRDFLAGRCEDTVIHIPAPGCRIDVAQQRYTPSTQRDPLKHDHRFEHFLAPIHDSGQHPALATLEGVQAYFDWAGFAGDLVLHVLETDYDFAAVLREYHVDFRGGARVQRERPSSDAGRYLRMRVRADVYRHVLLHGLSWEEISIGFHGRFFRAPDVYNFDFWKHFQDDLPSTTPPFAALASGG